MRLFLLRVVAPALLLAVHASTATACINDRESSQSEKEFKSSYIEKQPATAPSYQPPPVSDNHLIAYGGFGVGIAMLIGGCALGLVKKHRD